MRKSDNYAGNQVRLFLGDLKNGSHQSKIKSIEKLQNYIKTYQPNVRIQTFAFVKQSTILLLDIR